MEEVLKWMLPLMPWIPLVLGLDIHFKPAILKNLPAIKNSIALLFCYAITIIIESGSIYSLKFSPKISFYFILSLIFFIIFLTVLIFFSKKVNEGKFPWLIPFQLLIFLGFMTTFQTAFCLKQKFANYQIIRGCVLDADTKKPFLKHEVELTFKMPIKSLNEKTNNEGEFRFVFEKNFSKYYPEEIKACNQKYYHQEIILDTNSIDNNFEILLKLNAANN
jgi:energy-coupling factor transporter transmembrane protein EcfT